MTGGAALVIAVLSAIVLVLTFLSAHVDRTAADREASDRALRRELRRHPSVVTWPEDEP